MTSKIIIIYNWDILGVAVRNLVGPVKSLTCWMVYKSSQCRAKRIPGNQQRVPGISFVSPLYERLHHFSGINHHHWRAWASFKKCKWTVTWSVCFRHVKISVLLVVFPNTESLTAYATALCNLLHAHTQQLVQKRARNTTNPIKRHGTSIPWFNGDVL